MIRDIIQKYFSAKESETKAWKPARRPYVKSAELEQELFEKGYVLAGKLDEHTIEGLTTLYAELHNFSNPDGGMFYSVYSRDIEYRKKVHNGINEKLQEVYNNFFQNYRNILNSFIVKVSGPESEFSLHQDSTGIDEFKYSNLTMWIPLEDVNMDNGCLCVVPKSHHMFSPFRGMSFPPAYEGITDVLRQYLQPIEMQKGEILLFDNRLVHNSTANLSGADRAVVMSAIYPAEAPLIVCHKDQLDPKSDIELIKQPDDFLVTYENFMHDCTCRPEVGETVEFVKWNDQPLSANDFQKLCSTYGVTPTNIPELLNTTTKQTVLDTAYHK